MQRVTSRMITIVAAAAAALALPVPNAHAAAQGCTPTGPNGTVCVHVHGSGLHVSSVQVSRDKIGKDPICNYSAVIDVTGPDGQNIHHDDSGILHNGACSYERAYNTFEVHRDFPKNSHLCGRFFEDGKQQGGAPCETIK